MAVCSRCTGIYTGFLIGMLAYPAVFPFRHREADRVTGRHRGVPGRRLLLAAGFLMVLEWSMTHLHVIPSSNGVRALSGLLPGGLTAFLVLSALLELARKGPT